MTDTETPTLVDMHGAAAHLGLAYQTIRRYRARGVFPEPDAVFGQSPAWLVSTLDNWTATRPGRTGRPRKPRKLVIRPQIIVPPEGEPYLVEIRLYQNSGQAVSVEVDGLPVVVPDEIWSVIYRTAEDEG